MKQFLTPKKTLIIANGEKPSLDIVKYYQKNAEHIIALDGAADWLMYHNIIPEVVIGDMDSIKHHVPHTTLLINKPDQNSNDLEKALHYCLEQNLHHIIILGGFGQRMDHFLTNIYVLKKFASTMVITMVDDQQCAFICPLKQKVVFENCLGSYFSLFPLNDTVGPITTTGVAYPLHNEMLSLHKRIGTLNTLTHQQATLRCLEGDVLVLIPFDRQFLTDN